MPPTSQITTFSSTNHPGGNKLQRQRMLEEHRHERHEGKGRAGGGAEDTALPLSHSSHPSSAPTEPHSSQHYPSYEVQKKITWKELLLWRTIHAHFQPVNSFLFCRATVGSQRRAGLSQVSITAVVLPTSKPLF